MFYHVESEILPRNNSNINNPLLNKKTASSQQAITGEMNVLLESLIELVYLGQHCLLT